MADMSKMTDSEFWAEVRNDLDFASIGELADYVTEDAERRDPELARLHRERLAIIKAAQERAWAAGEDPLEPGSAAELTRGEEGAYKALDTAYRARFTVLAAPVNPAYLPDGSPNPSRA